LANKQALIAKHYKQVHKCNKCFNAIECNIKKDPSRVLRKVLKDALDSKVFIIAQALAQGTQRLSGIPYTYPNGQLSVTGNKLDKYLALLGYTIIPNANRKLVYSSDIVHCYPGKRSNGSGDNKPTPKEIQNCHSWFTKEIQVVRPKVLLLLGKVAAKTFFYLYNNEKISSFDSLLQKEFKMNIGGIKLSVFVLPHPASMYPNLSEIYKKTMKLLKLQIA
jgi:uracil-DNA glycosylase family 4